MPNPREIHRHMRSVTNIRQITKAMKMVASARLRKAQERAITTKPFAEKIKQLLQDAVSDRSVLGHIDPKSMPLLEQRPVKRTGYIVVSSDKGLAGPYNSNVLKHAQMELMDSDDYTLITVGRKAKEFFSRRGYDISEALFGFSDKPSYENANDIARAAIKIFLNGSVDEVVLIYTEFKSALSSTPVTKHVLPIVPPAAVEEKDSRASGAQASANEIIFEPNPVDVIKQLLPYYVKTEIYAALMQCAASELGARMTAMSSATDNASDLIRNLELSYNKARQAGITNEINEIVGGAEALNS